MKITVELNDSQATALETLGVDTSKAINEFAATAVNNKLKSTVMNSLKRVVVDGEAQYKALSKHMTLPLTSAEYIAAASTNYYCVAQSLGGRAMKPLNEIVRDILSGDSAIEE
jgi:hypothetical protein